MAREMRVVDYDPSWPDRFDEESSALRDALGEVLVRVHHIGSTSVPGLAAKPVIDVCLEVRELEALDACDDSMRSLGYVPRGEFGIPGRRYYPKGGEDRTHHVHAYASGDPLVAKHLALRDYLRAHPEAARAYAEIKREASAKHRTDPDGYLAHKDEFVRRTIELAMAWRARCKDTGSEENGV